MRTAVLHIVRERVQATSLCTICGTNRDAFDPLGAVSILNSRRQVEGGGEEPCVDPDMVHDLGSERWLWTCR
jgi:hypothetical protein